MIRSTARALIPAIADAVLAAIPQDVVLAPDAEQHKEAAAAVWDMAQAKADPREWVVLHGDDQARWALEKAVEATADYTINGWEDDSARLALNAFNEEDSQ